MKFSESFFCGQKLLASYRTILVVNLLICLAASPGRAADTTIAWGNDNNSQTTVPPAATNVVALAAGTVHSLALRSDGTVVGWGDNLSGQINVAGLTGVKAISAGSTYSLALLSNSTVAVRGTQLAPPAGLTNVTAIAAGWQHSLALKQDGTVVGWGDSNSVPSGLSNVVAIAAGDGHSLALLADTTLVAWGNTNFNKTLIPPGLSNVVAIAAGKDHCVALGWTGQLTAWGRNDANESTVPAGLSNVVAVTAGALHTVALRNDGTIAAWGDNTFSQIAIPGPTGFRRVSAGGYHNLGQLGDGSPFITMGPRDQQIPVSREATFRVLAVGSQPMTYQWRKNGTNLVGRTNNLLVLSNVQVTDAGDYSVRVVNSNGTATSTSARLTAFYEPPFIEVQPQDIATASGEDPVFSITVTGSQPLSYQWWFEDATIEGATNQTLQFTNVALEQAGGYSVVITNLGGSVTSSVANLVVIVAPPVITSSLSVTGAQGGSFIYQITATNYPIRFVAAYLPLGLSIDTNSGVISGTPLEEGTFSLLIGAINDYGSATETLTLTIVSGVPLFTSPLTVNGNEGQNLNYQITVLGSSDGITFDARNLPPGLFLDPLSGEISGQPVYAGTYFTTISASNVWGSGSAILRFSIANAPINGLRLGDFSYQYLSPYLLEFEFTLRDNNGEGIVVHPSLLTAVCMENTHPGTVLVTWPDDEPSLPTATNLVGNVIAETGVFIARSGGSSGGKVAKTYLVLDYTESVSDPFLNGDSNGDGISDAVEFMVSGAQYFVSQQPAASQVGIYEFHRDDQDPNQVLALTQDKEALNEAIAGIWTKYVNWFYAGSRCWDAVDAAILAMGDPNPDEQRSVVFISDGQDSSSLATVDQVISDAQDAGVRVYCIAYGNNPDTNTLARITSGTGGRLFDALSQEDLFQEFTQIAKDVQARYVLRWASLRRDATEIAPHFLLSYQGRTSAPPAWTWQYVTNAVEVYTTNTVIDVDTSVDPPVTNITETIETNNVTDIEVLWENSAIGAFIATNYPGTVTEGTLRLALDEEVEPTGITLRTTYIPRFVRQLRLHYRANWPCAATLNSTNTGELLQGWSLTQSNDVDGSTWLLLSTPNPQFPTPSLKFPGFGPLLTFRFNDIITNAAEAFALIEVDNSIYTNIPAGGQRFIFEPGNIEGFVTNYPALPFRTPVPWLIENGITGDYAAEELADHDGDGIPTWQEYRANTNPQDPDSRLIVRGLSNDEYGRYFITFSTALNRRYRVETSDDLINWQLVQDDVPGTGQDLTILDSRYIPWINQVFYRVVVY